ncbi:uncharacterized protein LAESUDRAFT_522550 [Laetiporus sulphureus 93-53]|uniref:Uncharacterized protein n=1 Tax=Laetiporus sulphureus 93-53 TaxID=1314785 RepID=A0A165BET1_9APHY|nr:uncharacterized protein LAESUDRAFT_522550 [Laetiporus sulphureus 93-53]KZT00898.1 hypothetical protein LAESUDRAFT_522550 [Laetiporus sulphureus 93-53]
MLMSGYPCIKYIILLISVALIDAACGLDQAPRNPRVPGKRTDQALCVPCQARLRACVPDPARPAIGEPECDPDRRYLPRVVRRT